MRDALFLVLGAALSLATAWFTQLRQDRREIIRRRQHSIELAYQALLNPFSATIAGLIDSEVPKHMGTPWYSDFNRTYELLNEIQLQARAFRGSEAIRDAARGLLLIITTANVYVNLDGKRLSPAASVMIGLGALRDAIYGDVGAPSVPDDAMKRVAQWFDEMPFPDER